MAVKLPDTLVPMADFPSAYAKDVQFTDGENLQDKLDNGKLGSSSGGTGLTKEQAQQLQTAYEHSQSNHVSMDEVNQAISNAQLSGGIDTTSFATDLSLTGSSLQLKNSSGNLIGNAVALPSGGGSVDLSNYYTKSEVDTQITNASLGGFAGLEDLFISI